MWRLASLFDTYHALHIFMFKKKNCLKYRLNRFYLVFLSDQTPDYCARVFKTPAMCCCTHCRLVQRLVDWSAAPLCTPVCKSYNLHLSHVAPASRQSSRESWKYGSTELGQYVGIFIVKTGTTWHIEKLAKFT